MHASARPRALVSRTVAPRASSSSVEAVLELDRVIERLAVVGVGAADEQEPGGLKVVGDPAVERDIAHSSWWIRFIGAVLEEQLDEPA